MHLTRSIFLFVFLYFGLVGFSGAPESLTIGADILDFCLIIDESGSMRYNDPHDMRIDAARLFSDLCMVEDRIALIGFGEGARVISEFKEIGIHKEQLVNSLSAIASKDRYSMVKEGLEETFRLFQKRQTVHPPVVVLLSDGEFQEDDVPPGTDLTKYLNELYTLSRRFGNQKIPIFTVAFTGSANVDVLSAVARESGGACYLAEKAGDIQEVYSKILENLRPFFSEEDTGIVLTDEEQEFVYEIGRGIRKLIVSVLKQPTDPAPSVDVFNPRGERETGEVSETPSFSLQKFDEPEPGKWTVRVKGKGKVNIKVTREMGVKIALVRPRGDELSRALGDELPIGLELTPVSKEISVTDFDVKGFIQRPDGTEDEIRLSDDGQKPDDLAGDGLFQGVYNRLNTKGKYTLIVRTSCKGNEEVYCDIQVDFKVEKDLPPIIVKVVSSLVLDHFAYLYLAREDEASLSIVKADAIIKIPKGNEKVVSFFDDGNLKSHGDQKANDGTFSGIFRETELPGSYDITFRAFFRLPTGETYTKQENVKFAKLIGLEEKGKVKLRPGKENVIKFGFTYFGNHSLSFKNTRLKSEKTVPLNMKALMTAFSLEVEKKSEMELTFTPSEDLKAGDYQAILVADLEGSDIEDLQNPNLQGMSLLEIPLNFHLLSGWELTRPWVFGALAIVVIILLIWLLRIPQLRDVFLSSPDGTFRYDVSESQKFFKRFVTVGAGSDVDIQEIPKNSFSLAIGKGAKVVLSATGLAEVKVNQKALASDGRVVLYPGDEIELPGAKFIYRTEEGELKRLGTSVIIVLLILVVLFLLATLFSVLALY